MLTDCSSSEWRRPNNSPTYHSTILDLPNHTQPATLPYLTYKTIPNLPLNPTYQTILDPPTEPSKPFHTCTSTNNTLPVNHTQPAALEPPTKVKLPLSYQTRPHWNRHSATLTCILNLPLELELCENCTHSDEELLKKMFQIAWAFDNISWKQSRQSFRHLSVIY